MEKNFSGLIYSQRTNTIPSILKTNKKCIQQFILKQRLKNYHLCTKSGLLPTSVNKVLSEHSHVHLLTWHLWLFSGYNGRPEQMGQSLYGHKAKNIYYLFLDRKLCWSLFLSTAQEQYHPCLQPMEPIFLSLQSSSTFLCNFKVFQHLSPKCFSSTTDI